MFKKLTWVVLFVMLMATLPTIVAFAATPMALAPEDLSALILGIAGVVLQLAATYVPGFSDWYQNLPNKGLAMLALVGVIGFVYFGLACTPLGTMLNIQLACTLPDLFVLLRAIFLIAMGQIATYMYTKKNVERKWGGVR